MDSSEITDPGGEAARTTRGLKAERRVFGRFLLRRVLGQGGMGVVWLAFDEKLQEPVALKFVPDLVRWNRRGFEELRQEAKRARALAHPNIVRVYDVFEDEEMAAIAMEYVEGETLAALAAARPSGVMEVEDIAPWIGAVGAALDYAHAQARVVHCDLKPSNLLLTREGVPKIADFGVARSLADSTTRLSNTSGGTVAYMSLQQQMGEAPRPADDIYALGATLYELLTGKPPFHTGNIAAQIAHRRPASMAARRREFGIRGAAVPPAWETGILACLAKEPDQRPASGAELVARLQRAGGEKPKKRKAARKASLAAVGLSVLAVAAWWVAHRKPATGREVPAAISDFRAFTEFTDDFSDGLGGWLAWGEPRPQRIAGFQGRQWVFDNNGDGMHMSGLTSLGLFSCPQGFVLEGEVFLSVTNPAGCHCEAEISLTREPNRWANALGSDGDIGEGINFGLNFTGDACWGTPAEMRRHAWWAAGYLDERGQRVNAYAELPQEGIQADRFVNRWVLLRVEVDAERRVRFLADGKVIWAPGPRLHPTVLQGQRVMVWGKSQGSAGKAYHDWVRLRTIGTKGRQSHSSASDTPVGQLLTWSGQYWRVVAGDVTFPASAESEPLALASPLGAAETGVRTSQAYRGQLAVNFELQPLLRSTPDGRDLARVGLMTVGADGRERFVGVELMAGEVWLIDTALAGNERRIKKMGGYAPGAWQAFSMHITAAGSLHVVGGLMENQIYELGTPPAAGWRVQVSVRDTSDGVAVQPVRISGSMMPR